MPRTAVLTKLLFFLVFAYLAVCLALFAFQTKLLFPAGMVSGSVPLPPSAERLTLPTDDGEQLHAVHIPPRTTTHGRKTAVLGFGGNAWNAEAAADYLHRLYPDRHVVAFHYRGYAPSTGTPSAKALLADAPRIHDFIAERLDSERIVAVGFSIGSGVAAHLASRRALAGLILVTPFDSLSRVAQDHYPWFPVRLLFRHHMRPAADLEGSTLPVAIVAAERDTLILPARTDALRNAVPNLVLTRTIGKVGHNDIYESAAFRQTMEEALSLIERAP